MLSRSHCDLALTLPSGSNLENLSAGCEGQSAANRPLIHIVGLKFGWHANGKRPIPVGEFYKSSVSDRSESSHVIDIEIIIV